MRQANEKNYKTISYTNSTLYSIKIDLRFTPNG
jgi:hypothetical protein